MPIPVNNSSISIGLPHETRFFIASQLNILVACQMSVYMSLLNVHWNVTGKHFGPLHLLFKDGYELLFETIDDTAERVAQLGFPAIGTFEEIVRFSPISNAGTSPKSATDMLFLIKKNLEILIGLLREIIVHVEGSTYHDSITGNFLAGLGEKYEKYYWMIRVHTEEA